jgi:hypothetical protein
MKTLLSVLTVLFFSATLFSQTNAGFAKVGGLGEGVACVTKRDAMVRLEAGLSCKKINHLYTGFASQSMQNDGLKYMGGDIFPADSIAGILGWLKDHPQDSVDYPFLKLVKLVEGKTYTFQTTSVVDGKVVLGGQITRKANKDEWALMIFDDMFLSTWCLNLFPTPGKVTHPKVCDTKPVCAKPRIQLEPLDLPPAVQTVKVCEKERQERVMGEVVLIVQEISYIGVDGSFQGSSYSDGNVQFLTYEEIAMFPRVIRRFCNPFGVGQQISLVIRDVDHHDRFQEAEYQRLMDKYVR